MKLFYINLDKRKDRNENIIKQMSFFQNIPYYRFSAIHPDNETLRKMVNTKKLTIKDYFYIMDEKISLVTRGSIGCHLSHLALFKQCDKNNEIYIILEDDIICQPWIEQSILEGLKSLNNDFDIIYLYQPIQNGWLETSIDYNPYFYKIHQGYMGTHGYILHPNHARYLYHCLSIQYVNHIDNMILEYNIRKPDTKVYLFKKPLIDFDSILVKTSDIRLPKKKRFIQEISKIANILYLIRDEKCNKQEEHWKLMAPFFSIKVLPSKEEVYEELKKTGGYFLDQNIYSCNINFWNCFKIYSYVEIESYKDKFFGCTTDFFQLIMMEKKSIDKNILILPFECFSLFFKSQL